MRNYPNVLLDPAEIALCIIDEQPEMFFGVESIERMPVMNAIVGLAKTAKVFKIPVIFSTVEAKTFSGPLYSKLQSVFPNQTPIDRTCLNAWEDMNFKKAVEAAGKKKIMIAGLWTEVCVTLPALSAKSEGYDVYIVADASAGASKEAHDISIQRMIQAGVKPVTWQASLLEMQRDWANKTTYDPVIQIITEHGGVYGLGLEYAKAMVPQNAAN
ncbi:MAG: hydrolase [Syntrophomonadaceae bacterium]|jgi:nicotinamidase-related amidase|nr:hydrolase [Syntrophomonadaceae bacterium]